MRLRRSVLISIALSYCVLSVLYAVLTPPWESPDEPAHYMYVSQLAARWRPPLDSGIRQRNSFSKDYPFISSNYEWYQPALGYLPGAIVYAALDAVIPDSLPENIPPLNSLFSTNPFQYFNLFTHANLAPLQVWAGAWGLLAIRVISSLLGLLVIYAAYGIGRSLDRENGWLGILAAGWLAFLPQFTFINASVRSDTLTNAVAAMVLLLAVLVQTAPERANRFAVGMGILLGLGLICKTTFVYMLPVGILGVILTTPRSPRAWIKPLILLVAPVVILWGGYYLAFPEARAALAYTLGTTLAINPKLLTWGSLKQLPSPLLIDLFYARFGWANVAPADFWSRSAFAIWLIGATATLVLALYQFRNPGMRTVLKSLTLLGTAILFALAGVVRFNLSVFQPQGRLLFPILAAWSVVGYWGLWQILPGRARVFFGVGTIGFMLVFNLNSLVTLISAYY